MGKAGAPLRVASRQPTPLGTTGSAARRTGRYLVAGQHARRNWTSAASSRPARVAVSTGRRDTTRGHRVGIARPARRPVPSHAALRGEAARLGHPVGTVPAGVRGGGAAARWTAANRPARETRIAPLGGGAPTLWPAGTGLRRTRGQGARGGAHGGAALGVHPTAKGAATARASRRGMGARERTGGSTHRRATAAAERPTLLDVGMVATRPPVSGSATTPTTRSWRQGRRPCVTNPWADGPSQTRPLWHWCPRGATVCRRNLLLGLCGHGQRAATGTRRMYGRREAVLGVLPSLMLSTIRAAGSARWPARSRARPSHP